jgi:hypothetical protein
MAYIKNDNRERWWVRNRRCVGAACLILGNHEHGETPLASDSANIRSFPCCLHNAYHGCPEVVTYSVSLAKERREEWGLRIEGSRPKSPTPDVTS